MERKSVSAFCSKSLDFTMPWACWPESMGQLDPVAIMPALYNDLYYCCLEKLKI